MSRNAKAMAFCSAPFWSFRVTQTALLGFAFPPTMANSRFMINLPEIPDDDVDSFVSLSQAAQETFARLAGFMARDCRSVPAAESRSAELGSHGRTPSADSESRESGGRRRSEEARSAKGS
jgi:hypothetical protein